MLTGEQGLSLDSTKPFHRCLNVDVKRSLLIHTIMYFLQLTSPRRHAHQRSQRQRERQTLRRVSATSDVTCTVPAACMAVSEAVPIRQYTHTSVPFPVAAAAKPKEEKAPKGESNGPFT